MVNGFKFLILLMLFTGCTHNLHNMPLVEGPKAVSNIETPYDDLLACLDKTWKGEKFSIGVGSITDETGKFSIGDAGTGKFITQGAGDIVQSALMQTGVVKVVNRRDPRVMDMELKYGRSLRWLASDYHITGSINSLDFLPGAGIDATVYGVGAKYRQYRMLVGMDLALTNTYTSEVVGVANIFKQIIADEMGAGVGRFFGSTLVSIDIGNQNREAIHFATRNMLKLAVYTLISDLYKVQENGCSDIVEEVKGVVSGLTMAPSVSVEPF